MQAVGFTDKVHLDAVGCVAGQQLFKLGEALLADGFHSLGDLVTGALSWVTWRWAQEPPDDDHHYGHGKLEALAAAVVGGMLIVTGVGAASESGVPALGNCSTTSSFAS